MLALYIILGILGFLFLLTLLNINIYALFDEELSLSVRIGFIKLRLLPPKPKKPKKKRSKKKKEEKPAEPEPEKEKQPSTLKKLYKQHGVTGLVNIVSELSKLAASTLKGLFSTLRVKKLVLDIRVAGEDAADSAIKYGYLCTALYPALGILMGIVKVKRYEINAAPDFSDEPKSRAYAEAHIKARILSLLIALVPRVIDALKLLIKIRNS